MSKAEKPTRRDFLHGRAAVRALADKAQAWVDSASELLPTPPAPAAMPHLHATRRAMACEFAIEYHAADREATDDVLAAFDLIESLEDQMTIYRDQSQVIEINECAAERPVDVEPGLFSLLETAARLYHQTDGALDITSTPLSDVWGFLVRDGRVPDDSQIEEARRRVGFDQVQLDAQQQTIRFCNSGVRINLNSLGKGYALDRATAMLDERGLTDYLWHGGSSSVLARGANRADQRQAWTLGLRHPFRPEQRIAEFHLRDRALATAGGATQFFEHEGRRYSHLLDPRTGKPAEGVCTATAIAPTAAEADGLATAFFVMGAAAVAEYCASHPGVGALLVCPGSSPSSIELHPSGLDRDDWTCHIQGPKAP